MREVSDMIEENISTSLANSISKDNNPDLDNFSLNFLYVMDLSSLGTETLKRSVSFSLM